RSKRTTPSMSAKSVSSRPRPTFCPGWNLVPRCRTRMWPASTRCPPNRFTPSRCAFESRPLRLEPTPFLCAMPPPSAEPDLADPDLGVLLPVSLLPAVVLAPLPLEHDDLLALAVRDDLGRDGSAVDRGRAHPDLSVRCGQQDLIERHGLADAGGDRRDPEGLSGLCAELFSAGADDRVHGSHGSV